LTHTHLDISFAVGIVSRFMTKPREIHYAIGTSLDLIGYMDSDWEGDLYDHNYTSSYIFHLGYGPICLQSKKQHVISLSSTDVEYQGVVHAIIKAIWLQNILIEIVITFQKPLVICCDYLSAI